MSQPSITLEDWTALARLHGEALASALVWQRIAAEREIELQDLRKALAAVADELHKPPDQDGGD